ncbi:Sugar kinase of the NBD/HSP70 family, may contain an N-terminal HTH domain [Jatrophihabitans endophyticus]|uniref:Sugar kinase of the NBD/HSP70 family, may contain an N-terminal HTH domain n=1 Tax=Jatrophihabitans endophyticus TaxID=1206085 RepID=A0A1M5IXE0_9ACTN|nr:ROK family protein [Jatrophihabitans endophyticus]SHG32719.1 Sugar kinase of the NBD/HSP70 family, may contain an N-terminal HTH domain [Jatrophihabitans endophyticus]
MTDPTAGQRDVNRGRVLAAVTRGANSRAGIVADTGLARSTVAGLVQELLAEGRLTEDAAPAGQRLPGRPPKVLRVAGGRSVVVAVDLGHSHCRVGVVAVEDGAAVVLGEGTARLDVDASPDEAVDQAVRIAKRLLRATRQAADAGGVGLPAPVDVRTGSVGTGNLLPRWVDRRPAAELSARLGVPFAADNDANLGALAEVTFGGARGVDDLVYVKAATGIGAGLLLGGRLHHGVGGRAGEIGHVPVDPGGPVCRCGNRGCLETVASTVQVLSAVRSHEAAPATMADVAGLVTAGDPGASRVVTDAGRMIGRVLADLVNNLSPRQIVVGGELAAATEPLLAGVRESIDRYAQPGLARGIAVTPSSLGVSAELLGAAALAMRLGHAAPS